MTTSNEMNERRVQSVNPKGQIEFNTEITDVNDLCILNIFKHLDVDDLMNFAFADESFTKLARRVYEYLYATGRLEIICGDGRIEATVLHNDNTFGYNGPICWLIERFGDVLREIHLQRNFMYKNYLQLEQCIVTHCAKTLTRLDLSDLGRRTNLLKNSFPNCELLSIDNATLDDDLLPLNECFPALKHLTLKNIVYCSTKVIDVEFSFLEHLTLNNAATSKIGSILPLNRQIRRLHVTSSSVPSPVRNLYPFLNETLPQLEELSVSVKTVPELTSTTNVSFKNVKKLEIKVEDTAPFALTFDVVEDLHIIGKDRFTDMIDFINKHSKIAVLRITSFEVPDEILKCISSLPNLTEFHLDLVSSSTWYERDVVNPFYVIQLLLQIRSVNFFLRLINCPNYAQAHIQSICKTYLGSEWDNLISQKRLTFHSQIVH